MIELLKQYCRLLDYHGSAINQILYLTEAGKNRLLAELEEQDPADMEHYIYGYSAEGHHHKTLIFSGYHFKIKIQK